MQITTHLRSWFLILPLVSATCSCAQWVENWIVPWNPSGTASETAEELIRNIDGGSLLIGSSSAAPSGFLVRTGPSGNLIWAHQANQNLSEYGLSANFLDVALNLDGNIALGGNYNDELNDRPALLVYMDQNGDTLWRHAFDTPGYASTNTLLRVLTDPDTNIIVVGSIDGGSYPSFHRLLLAKFSPSGQLLWQTLEPLVYSADDLVLAPDGGLYVAGVTNSDDRDFAVLRFSPGGVLLWVYTYDGHQMGFQSDDFARKVRVTANGLVLAAGSAMVTNTLGDLVAVALDSLGNELHTIVLGSAQSDYYVDAEMNGLGQFLICGNQELGALSYVPVLYLLNDSLDLLRTDSLFVSGTSSANAMDLSVLPSGDVVLCGTADDLISPGYGSCALWFFDGTSSVSTFFPAYNDHGIFKNVLALGGTCVLVTSDYGPVTTWDGQGITWGEYCFTPTGWSLVEQGIPVARAFPNPFFSELELVVDGKDGLGVDAVLVDMRGRIICTTSGVSHILFSDLQNLAAGPYQVRWRSSEGRSAALLVMKLPL